MKEFIEHLSSIFEETNINDLTPDTQFKNLPEWDSLSVLMLIALYDQKYFKKVSGKDILERNTIADLYELS